MTVFEIDDVKNKKSKLLASVSLRVGDSNTAGGDAQRTKSKMATEGGLTYEPSQTFGFDLNNVENLVEEDDLELVVEILDKTSLLGASIKKTVVSERRISVRRCLEVPGGSWRGRRECVSLGGVGEFSLFCTNDGNTGNTVSPATQCTMHKEKH